MAPLVQLKLITDLSLPRPAWIQHQGTADVIEAIPLSSLSWSLICVAMMYPASPVVEIRPLNTPRAHKLLLAAGSPPGWEDHWVRNVPLVGVYMNLLISVASHTTELEDVADFVAEDLESGSDEWVGKRVGIKQKQKMKSA